MKKLLAVVLAVALVAVGAVVGMKLAPAPVAAPEDDAVVPVADVTEAPAEDDVKTAVLGEFDPAAINEEPSDEPVALAEEEGQGGDEEGQENNTTNDGNENQEPAGAPAAPSKDAPRFVSDLSPDDTIDIDANGLVESTTVDVSAFNSSGSDLFFANFVDDEEFDDGE